MYMSNNGEKKKMSLATKSIIGVILGVVAGLILLKVPAGVIRDQILVKGLFHIVGDGYITLIKMTIVPFVFASLVMGISSASDVRQIGRIGSKIMGLYLVTTVLASATGILGGLILKPGVGFNLGTVNLETVQKTSVSFADTLLGMVPSNIVESMSKGNMIHVVIFATIFGIAISLVGKKSESVKNFVDSLNHIMLRIVDMVMQLTPIGVFSLMARTVVNLGYKVIYALGKYAIVEIFLFVIFASVVYMIILRVFAGLKVKNFIKKFAKLAVIPFSTSSSNATIPYSIQFLKDLGVSNKIASFTIPLGATVNMDGSAIMQGMTAVFVAQLYGIHMTLPMIIIIVVTATLATIGSPGMPGVVMVTLSVVLQSVGFPLESIALIIGIDRFTDMFKTVLNVMGDSVCSLLVAKSENELDMSVYNGENS